MQQLYHTTVREGTTFTSGMLPWRPCLPLDGYDRLLTYCDPSFTSTGDHKAIVLIGKKSSRYDIIWAWCRQASVGAMISAHYTVDGVVNGSIQLQGVDRGKRGVVCRHYMEANFIQKILLNQYKAEGVKRKYFVRLRKDLRKKPKKEARIENLTPLGDGGLVCFNVAFKGDKDMNALRNQFIGFPDGPDDGPDAVEGGIYILDSAKQPPKPGHKNRNRSGKYKFNKSRG